MNVGFDAAPPDSAMPEADASSVDASLLDSGIIDASRIDAASFDATPDLVLACVAPMHDTCLDPLTISATGTYTMSTGCAAFDYPTSCGLGSQGGAADVVAVVLLPAGAPVDVAVTVRSAVSLSVAIAGQCGDRSTELACASSAGNSPGSATARAPALGSTTHATAYPVYIATSAAAEVTLDVELTASSH